jgi:ABC-type antimicrobial peptide transport system permease subunit
MTPEQVAELSGSVDFTTIVVGIIAIASSIIVIRVLMKGIAFMKSAIR